MSNRNIIFLSLAAVVILIVLFFSNNLFGRDEMIVPPVIDDNPDAPVNIVQSGKIDEHLFVDNTPKDVNFCGKNYKVKQILIDGVDIVQRIAELATNDLIPKNIGAGKVAKSICDNIQNNNASPTDLDVGEVIKITGTDIGQAGDVYALGISVQRFSVNLQSKDIYTYGGFDGSPVGPIGKIK